MKQETNNEIDLLLRRMSRQNGGSVPEATEQHLDADELSSYAQNALPAAARARYMEHLAECSPCRKLVTELSLSLGATLAAAAPVETVSAPSALKKFLASLFSPMVLRYAVPALGLIVVAAIGFVILRQPRQDGFVAQLDTKQREAAPTTAAPGAATSSSSPNVASDDNSQKAQSGQVAAPVTQPKEVAPKSEGQGVPGGVLDAGPAPVPAPTPAPAHEETAAAAPPPKVAAEPPSAKTDFRADGEDKKKNEEKKSDAVAKKESAPTVQATTDSVSTAKANEPARDENRAANQRVDESKRESLPVQGRTATLGGVANVRRSRSQAEKDDAETRSVSGRRFRKERGVWTDTAYDSSTRTVDMARGSEQFRALVADEPEIKKIAEQLDGEVIVVWKGRAYRIR